MENLKGQIKEQIEFYIKEIRGYPHFSDIEHKIEEAEKSIGCCFDDISLLMLAFCRTKIKNEKGKNNKTYFSDTLATLGDGVLKIILIEFYFAQGKDKQEIKDCKEELEKNKTLFSIRDDNGWAKYLYHERCFYDKAPENDKVSVSAAGHEPCIEAIIGAIYLDKGIDEARKWIFKYIIHN